MHLAAASDLVLLLHGITASVDSVDTPSTIFSTAESIRQMTTAGLDFFSLAILCFDILACISTRSKPNLARYHHLLLSESSTTEINCNDKFRLHAIVGCENWTMAIIGEIATRAAFDSNRIHYMQEVAQIARDIQHRLDTQNSRVIQEV